MSQPVVVTIPHRLGKQEAIRRLQAGFTNVRSTFGEKFVVLKDDWAGDHLNFRASLLGQATTGTVDVAARGPAHSRGRHPRWLLSN